MASREQFCRFCRAWYPDLQHDGRVCSKCLGKLNVVHKKELTPWEIEYAIMCRLIKWYKRDGDSPVETLERILLEGPSLP